MKTFIIVVAAMLIIFVAAMLCATSFSYAQGLKGVAQKNDANRPGVASEAAPATVQGLVDKFDQVKIDDLTTALAYAQSEDDKAAVQCYEAWKTQVERIAKVRADNPDRDGVQIVTAFQKARNLVKRLDTDSPLRMACAALAADAKQDVRQFIGSLLSGVALRGLIP